MELKDCFVGGGVRVAGEPAVTGTIIEVDRTGGYYPITVFHNDDDSEGVYFASELDPL